MLTFASDKLGWSSTRTDELLLPVMKQLNRDEVRSNCQSPLLTGIISCYVNGENLLVLTH